MAVLRSFFLVHDTARRTAAEYMLTAPEGVVVQIKEPSRTLEQNAKFHAICGDFGKAGAVWAGKPRKQQQWKVLLVSGHAVATKEEVEIVPGLESEFVNIRESTALMSVQRSSSLIEYSTAWRAQLLGW